LRKVEKRGTEKRKEERSGEEQGKVKNNSFEVSRKNREEQKGVKRKE